MYNYPQQRHQIFTESGQRLFLAIRDQVHGLIAQSGAVTMGKATSLPRGISTANSWDLMACVDRLVELGEILEVLQRAPACGQDRVFVGRKSDDR